MSLTVQDAINTVTRYLREDGIEGADRDARILVCHALGLERGRLSLHLRDEISDADVEAAILLAGHRSERRPISHIIGYREFYGRRFKVDGDVLDPRPETEELIAAALAEPFSDILDLGTGTGCIPLTLLAERPSAVAVATDISPRALRVAEENARALGVADRVRFEESDWFAAVGGTYDLIVSNPPYIAADEMAGLAPELAFEPRMALTDEGDGLSAYRVIAAQVGQYLTPGGRVMVEIGWQQGGDVVALFAQAGLAGIEVLPDLDGRDRVVMARKT